MSLARRSSVPLALFLFTACGDGGSTGMPDMAGPDLGQPASCMSHTVPCTDESVLELALFRTPNLAMVGNQPDGDGWASDVDATAGGASPSKAYVYLKFTATGLERVDVGDEDAFNSQDWHIAARRFVIRLNSGVSGPSCVAGLRMPDNTSYDTLAQAPGGMGYLDEDYFTMPGCMFVDDGSGLGSSPATVTANFWRYTMCVQMTGSVYVLKLQGGRAVKLTVTGYYEPVSAQASCDQTSNLPGGATGGHIRLRWSFLGTL